LVQTGLAPEIPGDAQIAAGLARVRGLELARFRAPADPWSAAREEGRAALEVQALCAQLDALAEPLVVEGSGGIAVPLGERATLGDLAARAGCTAVLVVGLRLGCINHALLSLAYLAARRVPLCGAVLCDRFGQSDARYPEQVRRALDAHVPILGTIAFEPDASRLVADASPLFAALGKD
ncbi:MAG: ATP-dependent dethiobiotin synthetase BioD, partial [Vulcanimicrobiaceae bacterium]